MPEHDLATRISDEMTKIFEELPKRLNIAGILRDIHQRITLAVGSDTVPPAFINEKVVEVLREIATHAVEELTRRTGQPFLWVDDPPEVEPETIMSIGVEVKDGKGNITF